MAEDWIKMRTDLYRDPKVCMMADLLMTPEGELARYVNQHCQRDMSVTRNVMRNVTVGALVSVWGVMRMRGKREDDDLVCHGVTVSVLDDIAELPGFGAAMESVGWAVMSEAGLTFPRFFEDYNVDPGTSSKGKAAERQRRLRERRKASNGDSDDAESNAERNATRDVTSSVTRDVTVTQSNASREEKRRDKKHTPIPPEGGETTDSKKRATIALKTFLENCRSQGEKPVPEGDTVFDYADKAGIPLDILRLHWQEFKARYSEEGAKRYKDWRAVYRKSVRGNWFKLWWLSADGTCALTTVGEQAKRAHGRDAA